MKRIFTSIQEQRHHEMNEAFTNLEKICNNYGFTIQDIKIVKIEDNKAREYSSPIIEELLNETTTEELERIDKSMEDEKVMKQTAVEKLEKELKERYSLMNSEPLFEQAKEMFEEQLKDAYNQGYRDGQHDASNIPLSIGDISEYINAEQYYNETFNK